MGGRRADQVVRALARARQAARREEGFTFPELTVTATVMLAVAVAVMGLILVAVRQENNQADRVVALDSARNAMLRMTTEVRSAAGLNSVHPQVLDVLVHVPADTANPYHWVRYKCAGNDQGGSQGQGGTCTRQDKTVHSGPDCAADGSGPGCIVLLRRVIKYDGAEAFAEPCDNYDPGTTEEKNFCVRDNRTVQFSVFVEVPGAENPIELRGATTVRNCLDNDEEVVPCVSSTPST